MINLNCQRNHSFLHSIDQTNLLFFITEKLLARNSQKKSPYHHGEELNQMGCDCSFGTWIS